MTKIEYSPKAINDLQNLNDYIIKNWGETTSKNTLKKITSKITSLEDFSSSGINLGKIINIPTDYYYIFIEKNYVFYRLESNMIQIVRIINENQNYMLQLFGISSDIED